MLLKRAAANKEVGDIDLQPLRGSRLMQEGGRILREAVSNSQYLHEDRSFGMI